MQCLGRIRFSGLNCLSSDFGAKSPSCVSLCFPGGFGCEYLWLVTNGRGLGGTKGYQVDNAS